MVLISIQLFFLFGNSEVSYKPIREGDSAGFSLYRKQTELTLFDLAPNNIQNCITVFPAIKTDLD